MDNTKYLDLMAKYLSGNLAKSERETLFSWVERDARNRAFFDEVIELWSVSGEMEEEPFETDTEAAWHRFEERLDAPRTSAPAPGNGQAIMARLPESADNNRRSKKWAWTRYAAAILLLVVAGYGWYADPLQWWTTTYRTAAQETVVVDLPDGSEVTLNESTTLAYRARWGQRRVTLAGEAFFDVERKESQPFVIFSGAARTQVLGTSFNVRAYPEEDRIEVTVESGTVRVETRRPAREARNEAVVLEAGHSAVLDESARELRETETAISNATAWKTGELAFEDVPLAEVIPVLERLYGISIEVDNDAILQCTFKHRSSSQSAESVLQMIDLVFDEIQVQREPDGRYLLLGSGCSNETQ